MLSLLKSLVSKIYSIVKVPFFRTKRLFYHTSGLTKIHLGCGNVYLKGYINVDISPNSVADVVEDIVNIKNIFSKGSFDEILMIHSISYLRMWEAQEFFRDCTELLKKGGRLVLELPDIGKCAALISNSPENSEYEYLEGLRAVYAFDLTQIENKEDFTTYRFGWSGWYLKKELLRLGFSEVKVLDPETHEKRKWRDVRIEAIN